MPCLIMLVFYCLYISSEIASLIQSSPVDTSKTQSSGVDLQNDPTELVKVLLERSIHGSHKRPRKAVTSYSIVKFKSGKTNLKRKYTYPSTWGNFMLYCRTGWLLQVLPNGVVNGTNNINEANAVMQVQVVAPMVIRIKGIESGRYIAVNARGRLVSKVFEMGFPILKPGLVALSRILDSVLDYGASAVLRAMTTSTAVETGRAASLTMTAALKMKTFSLCKNKGGFDKSHYDKRISYTHR